MKNVKNVKNKSNYQPTGNPRGRPKKERVFTNKPEIEAGFQNLSRKQGGGSVIDVNDSDKNFNTNIIEQKTSHIKKLDVNEEGNIMQIKATNRYGKEQSTLISKTPQNPKFYEKQKQIKKDIETKNVTELKKEYSIADLRSFADTYDIKSTNRHDERADLIHKLKNRLASEKELEKENHANIAANTNNELAEEMKHDFIKKQREKETKANIDEMESLLQ